MLPHPQIPLIHCEILAVFSPVEQPLVSQSDLVVAGHLSFCDGPGHLSDACQQTETEIEPS